MDVEFTSGIKVIKHFSKTDAGTWPKSKEKQRNERSLKKLLFCTEVGCSEVFYDQDEYEKHIAEGSHTSAADKTSMDKVRRSFTDGGHEAADIDIQSACNNR